MRNVRAESAAEGACTAGTCSVTMETTYLSAQPAQPPHFANQNWLLGQCPQESPEPSMQTGFNWGPRL